jgi:molybdopterin molybdotransferase
LALFKTLSIEEACRVLARHIRLFPGKTAVSLQEALGRRLYEDVEAPENVPDFSRSTMDGFAVRAGDTFGASQSLPAYLEVAGEVFMGKGVAAAAKPGQAWRIPTGGMLPVGCDAVVMVEHTEELDGRTIGVTSPVAPGDNIVLSGEDIAGGEILFRGGRVIRAQEMGTLSAAGITSLDVQEPLRISIISTGDEVVEPASTPGPGQVRDVNGYTLYGLAARGGVIPRLCGIVGDDYRKLREVIETELRDADMVLLSGGSSVGTRDVSSRVIEDLGHPGILFHGLAIKPGKPAIGAVIDGKPVFGLPGHPVSAMVVFMLLVEPLLSKGRYPADADEFLLGFPVTATITRSLRSAPGREDFVRVSLRQQGGKLLADPVPGKSGLISTMSRSDGLARIPADLEGVEAGEQVRVRII